MSLKPKNAVTIIECDINIEFDAAEGYVEPEKPKENKVENQKAKEGLIKVNILKYFNLNKLINLRVI